MSEHPIKIGLVAVALSSLMIFALSLPAASALTPRDLSILPDNHTTDRFSGGQRICGDHICSDWQWSHMKNLLHRAQSNAGICAILESWHWCGETVNQPTNTKGN